MINEDFLRYLRNKVSAAEDKLARAERGLRRAQAHPKTGWTAPTHLRVDKCQTAVDKAIGELAAYKDILDAAVARGVFL